MNVSLEVAKRLKEKGYPQDGSLFYWVEAGHKYGDGYGNNAQDLSKEELVCVFGVMSSADLGEIKMNSTDELNYKGDIKVKGLQIPEYSPDNCYEIPLAACCAAPSVEELMEWLKDKEFEDRRFGLLYTWGNFWIMGGLSENTSEFDPEFYGNNLLDALVSCAEWVLEEKK